MCWIPVLRFYALAKSAEIGSSYKVLGVFEVKSKLLRFWFILSLILDFVPYVGIALSIILQTVCLGTIYQYLYFKLGFKGCTELKDTLNIGLISGLIPVVGLVEFAILYKRSK